MALALVGIPPAIEAHRVDFRCLVEVDRLGWISDVQVEHVGLGVVLNAVKARSPIVTVMASFARGMQ